MHVLGHEDGNGFNYHEATEGGKLGLRHYHR